MKKHNFHILWISVFVSICLTLIILFLTKVISYGWTTGFVLGSSGALIGYFIWIYGVKYVLQFENKYLLIFVFLLRYGIYALVLILSVVIPNNIFDYRGVIIGLIPIICFGFIKTV